ncbi:MAG: hypothetical protein AAF311_13415, partial [Pseudomonadota bacterium]
DGQEIGRVDFAWGKPLPRTKHQLLFLTLSAGIEVKTIIAFNRREHIGLIEGILSAETAFLSHGEKGEQIVGNRGPKLRMELPTVDFREKWDPVAIQTVYLSLKKSFKPKSAAMAEAKRMLDERRALFQTDGDTFFRTLVENDEHLGRVTQMMLLSGDSEV